MYPSAKNEFTECLNQLIALERSALDACEAAASRSDDIAQRVALRDMVRDHLRRIDTLSRLVREAGGQPTHDTADLANDRQTLRELEDDRVVLNAVLENQHDIVDRYRSVARVAAQREPRTQRALERYVEQHRQQQAWLNSRLGQH